MISSRQCYVYLQPPGTTRLVTCGRFTRTSVGPREFVGKFQYGRRYRASPTAVPLDPFHLPLTDRPAETSALLGVFGALRDAAPDQWGRRLLERKAGRAELDEMDYLLDSTGDRPGALAFGDSVDPPPPHHAFAPIVSLTALLKAAEAVEDDPTATSDEAIDLLLMPGSTMGGARPKAVVEDADGLWIAKFPSRHDRWNVAPVEAAMLTLAERCGLTAAVPRTMTVAGKPVVLIRRFDRERIAHGAYYRHRMVSALTAVGAQEGFRDAAWSYLALADELRRWSRTGQDDRRELFGRMAFNALISNNDDHLRNHALVAPDREFRLAPAYDLLPYPTMSHERHLALACGIRGTRASRENLLTAAARFGYTTDEANARIDAIKAVIQAEWETTVRRFGGTSADCAAVASAFSGAGFEDRQGND